MAVQARYLSHAFRVADDVAVGSSVFLDEFTRCAPAAAAGVMVDTTMLRDLPRSDLTCSYGFEPRKRARVAVAADGFVQDLQRAPLPQVAAQLPVGDAAPCGALFSSAPSTSGRAASVVASVSGGLLSRVYDQGDEIDAFVRLESERMRAGLQEVWRRHARALLSAAERAASSRLRAAEAELQRLLRRNAELEDKERQAAAECQAWMGVARSHEAVAAGLGATLDQLLQSPREAAVPVVAGEAEDAQSCCFEEAPDANVDDAASNPRAEAASACRACGGGEALVLLLPCRHLCLCRACDVAVDACPVCAAAKNASLHVLLFC